MEMKELMIGLISLVMLLPLVLSATSDTSDVTLTVTQQAPTIGNSATDPILVTNNGSTPTIQGIVNARFWFVVNDKNGRGNISNSSVWISLNKTGEASKTNTSCEALGISGNNTAWNYSCSINMLYYYSDGNYDLTIRASDGITADQEDDVSVYEYGVLSAMKLNMSDGSDWTAISFGNVAPGSSNQGASNEPYVINNTGNQNLTYVRITALDLEGDTDDTETIQSGNFSSNTEDSTSGETSMVNNTATQVSGAFVSPGAPGAGEEELYFFVDVPGTLTAQSFSPLSAWTIAATTS